MTEFSPSPSNQSSSPILSSTQTPMGTNKGFSTLTSKLTTVLSTSYSDTEFRDALSLLDSRGLRNDAKERRQIRLDLLKEVIGTNAEVVFEFGHVAEQLKRMRGTLEKMVASYDDMKSQVLAAHRDTFPIITESSTLIEQRGHMESKQDVLNTFKRHFIMTDDEVAILTQSAEPVGEPFFEILAKAKKITTDCEVLLSFENQALGLELLQQTSKNINLGFHKLYMWVQREFKALNLENPQMSPFIRKSLRILSERPNLFQNCLDAFATARERTLTDSFYLSLTGRTPSNTEDSSLKPIDLVAYDSLRYVGDMLAWVHSAAVSEREALEILFVSEGEVLSKSVRTGSDTEIWRVKNIGDGGAAAEFDALQALGDLVDRDISGVARILRGRVDQVIRANEEVVQAYKLSNLINFYHITFRKLLGGSAKLVECMGSLENEALRQFRALIRDQIITVQRDFQQMPSDLGPPKFFQESLLQLDTIAQIYNSSLSVVEDREAGFDVVLAEAFEPFISGCEEMSRTMSSSSRAIFLVNCKQTAAKHLAAFDFMQKRESKLRQDVRDEFESLVQSQFQFLVQGSGMSDLFHSSQNLEHLSDLLTTNMLSQASQKLDDFLPSALMDAMGNLKHLQEISLGREITEEAAEQFCKEFEKLESSLKRLSEIHKIRDDDLKDVLRRTSSEIRVLLS